MSRIVRMDGSHQRDKLISVAVLTASCIFLAILIYVLGLQDGRDRVAEDCVNYGKFMSHGTVYLCQSKDLNFGGQED